MSKEARGIFNVLFVSAAVGVGLYLSREPWQAYQKQRAAAATAATSMRNAEKQRIELTRDSIGLDSSAAKAQLAREHGYIPAGEQRLEAAP